jgi:hypothetical protein
VPFLIFGMVIVDHMIVADESEIPG